MTAEFVHGVASSMKSRSPSSSVFGELELADGRRLLRGVAKTGAHDRREVIGSRHDVANGRVVDRVLAGQRLAERLGEIGPRVQDAIELLVSYAHR